MDLLKTVVASAADGRQEAQLLQADRVTCFVSKFMLCFTRCGSHKGFKQQKWSSRSFKGIGNDAIQ